MTAFLTAQEGILAGTILSLEEGENEWVIGRDPDLCSLLIEDPTVSRKHLQIHKHEGRFIVENLSLVSPARLNGMILEQPRSLKEGDILELGAISLTFSIEQAATQEPLAPSLSFTPLKESLSFFDSTDSRWMLKVISGSQQGAEFFLHPGQEYTIGKDPSVVDVCLYDTSISKEHARLFLSEDEEELFIEDLASRNGTFINGAKIEQKTAVFSGDLITLGTTSFLTIDRQAAQETIYAPQFAKETAEEQPSEDQVAETELVAKKKDWHDISVPKRHLIFAGLFALIVISSFGAIASLFHGETIVVNEREQADLLEEAMKPYPAITYSFNPSTEKLFLSGHVLSNLEHERLIYMLKNIPFLAGIEDSLIIDEQVWENMNALLATNSAWRSVLIQSMRPGLFVVRGYVATQDDLSALSDYLGLNFPYQDKLQQQVVVASNIELQIQNRLLEKGFASISFKFTGGDLLLSGRVNHKDKEAFEKTASELGKIEGVRFVKNFVIFTNEQTGSVDLSANYKVRGFSEVGNKVDSVLVGDKIYRTGDSLDGMIITSLSPQSIFLEKDGVQYRIDYRF